MNPSFMSRYRCPFKWADRLAASAWVAATNLRSKRSTAPSSQFVTGSLMTGFQSSNLVACSMVFPMPQQNHNHNNHHNHHGHDHDHDDDEDDYYWPIWQNVAREYCSITKEASTSSKRTPFHFIQVAHNYHQPPVQPHMCQPKSAGW